MIDSVYYDVDKWMVCILVLIQLDTCLIDGECYDDGEPNPNNAAEACKPEQDRDNWSMSGRNSNTYHDRSWSKLQLSSRIAIP